MLPLQTSSKSKPLRSSELQGTCDSVLHNLKQLQANPPSLHVSVCTEVERSLGDASKVHGSTMSAGGQIDSIIPTDDIDWDISVDANEIDWDIGAVEQPVEESGDGFGSYEIIDANIELAGSDNYNVSVSDNPSLNKEDIICNPPESEICWDITADNSEESSDYDNIQNTLSGFGQSQSQTLGEERSRLLEKEYRNDILDDLLEVCFDH